MINKMSMNLNQFAMKVSGTIFILLGVFSMMTAIHAPSDAASAKIGFGIAAAILFLWGAGLLSSDYFVSLMNIKDAYPDWAESTNNQQLLQMNEESSDIKPVPKSKQYAVFKDAVPSPVQA